MDVENSSTYRRQHTKSGKNAILDSVDLYINPQLVLHEIGGINTQVYLIAPTRFEENFDKNEYTTQLPVNL